MVKFQSYLAGCVFALLLTGHIAMAVLDAYPTSRYLWHLNLVFAREIRPLLDSLDLFAGSPVGAIVVLSVFAAIAVLAARRNMRVLAAANAHVALAMVLVVTIKSYRRGHSGWLSASPDDVISALTGVTVVQYALFALAWLLLATCLWSHVTILQRGMAQRRRRVAAARAASESALRNA